MLNGISIFLPGYFEGDSIHHRVSCDALVLVCGNLATLEDGTIKSKAYSWMPHKTPLYTTVEADLFAVPEGVIAHIKGFASDINLLPAPFVVIAFCAALAQLVADADFEHCKRLFSKVMYRETIGPLFEGRTDFEKLPNMKNKYVEQMLVRAIPYEKLRLEIVAEEASSVAPSS